jgi:catechol 2,3-dioxygenase-like lactoylglutathione lyase family enzyme
MLPQLGATDVAKSIEFYRDILGFHVNWVHRENGSPAVTEVQQGPGKIQLAAHEGVQDSMEQRRARRATILFFETDDVYALHAEIQNRGGKPSDLEIVNYWLQMRMFSIADPDDHQLWFGQRLSP